MIIARTYYIQTIIFRFIRVQSVASITQSRCYSCPAIVCEEPPEVPNAQFNGSPTTLGGVVNYTCNAGYKVATEKGIIREFQITCLLHNNMVSAYWSKPAGCIGKQQTGNIFVNMFSRLLYVKADYMIFRVSKITSSKR